MSDTCKKVLRKGAKVEAVSREDGRKARDCPCKIAELKTASVTAVDKRGNARDFYFHDWDIVVL